MSASKQPPQTHKICNRCGIDKSAAEFSCKSDGRLRFRCKVCNAAILMEPTGAMFEGWLKRNYGVSLIQLETFAATINNQGTT
jgi:hypothetical protein